MASCKVNDDMVIAIDPGDIRKKYGKKMEYIAKIRDGSEKEIGEGYWLCRTPQRNFNCLLTSDKNSGNSRTLHP